MLCLYIYFIVSMAFSIGSSLVNATSSGLKMPGIPAIGTITLNSAKTASMAFTPGVPPGFTYSATTTQGDGTGTGTASPISISGLKGNTSYNFILTAYRMTLSKSATSSSYLTKPDTVTIGAVTLLEITTASVGYTSPVGGAATYTITTDSSEGTGSTTVGTNPIPVTGLLGNKLYKFTITASNDTGSSTSTTAGSYLTKPTIVTIGAVSGITNSGATVAYTYATGNAATYTVTTDAAKGTGTGASPISVTGLDPNVSYYFIVTASNATGSNASKTTSTYLTKPGEPTLGTITVTGLTASVGFTAPTGGATDYTVSTSPGTTPVTGTTSPISITTLLGNTSYTFGIYASNGAGTSSMVSSVSTYLTRPDAPTIGSASVSGTTASVLFTAPGGTGTITSYTATSNIGSLTGTGTSSPISVTGLTAGNEYKFTVTATNATGISAASLESNGITPISSQSMFRYYKFTPTALMTATEPMVQISELIVGYNNTRVDYTGATASNPGGNNPSSETPAQGIDNNKDTKWLDKNILPLIIDFGANRTANMYTFSTANDSVGRDPKSWTFHGSNDNSNWTLLDTQTNYTTTTVRLTQLPWFNFINYIITSGLLFRVKTTTATVPSTDAFASITITNNSSVTAVADPAGTRGYVFQLSGSNFLSISINTPTTSTKTLWVYSSTPSTGNGNVFSSNAYPVWFSGSAKLHWCPGYSGQTTYSSAVDQGAAWTFYAITCNGSSTYMYINGSSVATGGGTNSFAGDTADIQLGAYVSANNFTGYLDDMRLYNTVLTAQQILAIYNGS